MRHSTRLIYTKIRYVFLVQFCLCFFLRIVRESRIASNSHSASSPSTLAVVGHVKTEFLVWSRSGKILEGHIDVEVIYVASSLPFGERLFGFTAVSLPVIKLGLSAKVNDGRRRSYNLYR